MHGFELIWAARHVFAEGLVATLQVFLPAAAILFTTATLVGVAQTSRVMAIRWTAVAAVELFRGVPLLVLLFWMYFCLPYLGVQMSPLATAILGCGLNSGAYGAEIVRGALQSVPRAQTEAGVALNFSSLQRFWFIVLPLGLPVALPPLCNQTVELLKSTSVVSLITVGELTFQAAALRTTTMRSIEIFGTVLIMYFVLSILVVVLFRLLEILARRNLRDAA